jgi:hypothetical protein
MELVGKCLSFTLAVAFFFGFGWYGYLVNRLWGTTEYGGRRYISACLKALSTGLLLLMAILVARMTNTTDDAITLGMILAAPFLMLGWFAHRWQFRAKRTAGK